MSPFGAAVEARAPGQPSQACYEVLVAIVEGAKLDAELEERKRALRICCPNVLQDLISLASDPRFLTANDLLEIVQDCGIRALRTPAPRDNHQDVTTLLL